MIISQNITRINKSGTIALFARMKELQNEGRDIIPMAIGELDCDTPDLTKQAAIDAINSNQTRYTFNSGILPLRSAICDEFKLALNLDYQPDQILVSNGSKQTIYNLLFAMCDSGDEVIIFSPYYPSYTEQIKMCGAKVVIVETKVEDGYQVDPDRLRAAITSRTRVIISNSPNNPTGAVLNDDSLESIANVASEFDLWIISDEIYDKIIFPPAVHKSPAQLSPEIKKRTIVINGFSKSFAMTGWRLGYGAGPKEIISAAALAQSHITNNACSISQHAGVAALKKDRDFGSSIRADLIRKRDTAASIVGEIPGISFMLTEGAFYLFLALKNRETDSNALAMKLLEEYGVALVAGAAFGAEGHLRISFAASVEQVKEGCLRLKSGLAELLP